MTKELLDEGIALAKAGRNSEAREVLGQVVKDNPRSVPGWLWLAGVVETKKQRRYCLERVLKLNPQNQVVRQVLARVETAEPQVAASGHYFVSHQAPSPDGLAIRETIASVFGPLGYAPRHADEITDDGDPQSLLLKTCQQIFLSTFAIFLLSSPDPNAYLELGIALGFNRPILVLAQDDTGLPSVLEGHHVITFADLTDLQAQLTSLSHHGFPPTSRPVSDYCYFCGRSCHSLSTPPNENAYLVLNESKMLWRNLMRSLEPHLSQYHLLPDYLSDRSSTPWLCDARSKVLASQFALCHLGAFAGENSLLALGMAIGSRVPWILLSNTAPDSVPSLLQGFDRIQYSSLSDLEEHLSQSLQSFLSQTMPGLVPPSRNDKTSLLSLPPWVQLEDWINRVKHAAREPVEIQGSIRLIHYEGPSHLAESVVPARGLVLGRDPASNLVVENQGVSSRHCRILKGRNRKYFIEDLHSKNGTFLNGTRLSPDKKVEIRPNDVIRIPGARFLVWDDRPLPKEKNAQILGDTDLLPPILRIELPDISPPAYLSTWDHSMVLTVSLPDGRTHSALEVQAYYPMKRIVSALANLLNLPKRKYRLMINNEIIGEDETPLSAGVQKEDVLIVVPE